MNDRFRFYHYESEKTFKVTAETKVEFSTEAMTELS